MLSPARYLGDRCALVLDDDAEGPDFLARLLRAAGVPNPVAKYSRVEYGVKTLRRCLERAPEKLPMLILLAAQNPELVGFETVEWIRSKAALDGSALIMLTAGSVDLEYANCAQRMGVDALLEKYPGPNVLRLSISRALRDRLALVGKPEPIFTKPVKRPRWLELAFLSSPSCSGV